MIAGRQQQLHFLDGLLAPAALEEAVGYGDGARRPRYLGLRRTASGDEVVVADGRSSFAGDWAGYLALVRHPLTQRALAALTFACSLGSSETEATHLLILDRDTRRLAVADRPTGRGLLAEQWPPRTPRVLTRPEWERLRQELNAALHALPGEIDMGEVERQQAAAAAVTAGLDAQAGGRTAASSATHGRLT